jgi:hypothetical protein
MLYAIRHSSQLRSTNNNNKNKANENGIFCQLLLIQADPGARQRGTGQNNGPNA